MLHDGNHSLNPYKRNPRHYTRGNASVYMVRGLNISLLQRQSRSRARTCIFSSLLDPFETPPPYRSPPLALMMPTSRPYSAHGSLLMMIERQFIGTRYETESDIDMGNVPPPCGIAETTTVKRVTSSCTSSAVRIPSRCFAGIPSRLSKASKL